MKKLVIFGTGSLAEVAHFYFKNDTDYEVVAFTSHREYMKSDEHLGLPLVSYEDLPQSHSPDDHSLFIAVGYNRVNHLRAELFADAKSRKYRLATYISSRCSRIGEFPIGENCFILEDNTIQPFTQIGDNVVMWSGNHIGHHSQIGNHCFITSHVVVSGHCRVGDYSFLGVNATLRDNITIGESCVIGAGALLMKSTRDKEVYVGERTKPFAKKSDEISF